MKDRYTAAVITVSDKGSRGERVDESGAVICEILEQNLFDVPYKTIVADEVAEIQSAITTASDMHIQLIITTGGTGFSKRDVTPEATLPLIERDASGIAEAIRYYSLQVTPRAMLSRGVSGIRGDSLIVNLPGSPKAVREALGFVLDSIKHGLDILCGDAVECARK